MAQTPNFVQGYLLNAPSGSWTSLQFGPDGRLYASQVDGTIYAFTVTATPDGYSVTGTETISLVKSITNYDDDGLIAASQHQGTRQVTGILVAPGAAVQSASTLLAADITAAPAVNTSTAAAPAASANAANPGVGQPPGQAKKADGGAPVVPPPLVATIAPPPGQKDVPAGTFVADVNATDPEGDPLSYSLHPRKGVNNAFAIDSATGVITVADPSKLDRGNAQGPRELEVRVSDGKQTSTVEVLVSVIEPGTEPTPSQNTVSALAAPGGTPVALYVSSSDPRIGAGPNGGDVNLDTNSGVISRLTQNADGTWTRVDLVRGLPRSEENHSVNGMQLSADGTKLYVPVGGFTNQGAPSNNFAYTPEYALSAAILVIDLAAIDALPTKTDPVNNSLYKYDLPTLDGNSKDPNTADPFGGADGLNQAIIVPNGPVQIYSPGYRNAYDLVLTEAGKLYTIDNGGNAGWGGLPIGEGPPASGASSVTNAPNNGGPDTTDHLHLVTQGFYGGFPNPIRANPSGAGWYVDGSATPVPASGLPAGWPPVPNANPIEGDFLQPGSDGALYSNWFASTNGLAEYASLSSFEGAMKGNLLAVGWDDHLHRIELDAAGTGVTAVTKLTEGSSVLGNGLPLDVTAQKDGQTFAGTIWVANYGGGITVFTPSNAAPPPPSNDADADGLSDSVDAFAEDPANGKATDLAPGQTLTWNFSQNADPPGPNALFNMGFTGLMSNGTQSYLALYDPANIKAGGAAAGFQVEQVSAGDALVANDQKNGFQFGLDVLPEVTTFTVEAKIDNPFGGDPSTTPVNWKSQGFYIGAGDQSNYLKVVAAANGGAGGIEVASENAGAFSSAMYAANITGAGIQTLDSITLKLTVNADTGVATPSWTYTVGGSAFNGSGTAVQLSGATLQALQGSHSVGGAPSGLALGIISTSYGSGEAFPAFWESIKVTADGTAPPPPPADTLQARLSVTPGGGINASTWEAGSFKVENLSTGGQELTTVVIDLSGSVLAGMVFDPTGQAGDQVAKAFTVDQATGFTVAGATFGGGSDAAGYKTLTLQLQDFDPGETLLFSVDVDPASIQGVSPPGPGESGSVAGVELTGATVSFGFGGTTLTNEIFEDPGSVGGATVLAAPGLPAAPTVTVSGVSGTTGTVGSAQQTVAVTGPANATVRVLVVEGAQYTAGVPAAAPDLGPYEANSAVKVTTYDVALGSSGSGQAQVTLSKTVPEGGLNLITAAVLGAGGAVGPAGAPVSLRLDAAQPPPSGVVVTQSGGSTAVAEGGATDGFTVALAGQPSSDVTVTVSGNADVAVAAGPGAPGATAALTFTPQNWSAAQAVTAAAVDDTAVEGPETTSVAFAVGSADAAYGGLAVAPVSVAVADNDQTSPPRSPVVVGGADALSGTAGAQSWGPLAVSAKTWAGAAAPATKTGDGLGVQGGRFNQQVDYNPSTGASETLTLGFNGPVDSATFRVARMNPAENGPNAEVGAWKAYDAAGALVGEGLLDPRGKTAVAQWTYDFAIDPAANFKTIELAALPYNNGAPGGTGESSDFALAQVTYLSTDPMI